MKIKVSMDATEIKSAIREAIHREAGVWVNEKNISIQVRSKQNYRDKTWEDGELKAEFEAVQEDLSERF